MSVAAWGEWLLILIIAFIVIGPKDLPKILYHVGRLMRILRAYAANLQHHIDQIVHLGEIQDHIDQQKKKDKHD